MFCVGADAQSFHLLLKTGIIPISTVMKRLLTSYATPQKRWDYGGTGEQLHKKRDQVKLT